MTFMRQRPQKPPLAMEFGASSLQMRRPRPFLKWAGGKSRLAPEIRNLVPTTFRRYIEPFLGGGAIFFKIQPASALLSDSNYELINCYEVVREHPEELLRMLETLPISKRRFCAIRKMDPAKLTPIERAARLIYLNKICYNGLYRVNKKGEFNTPYGHYHNVKLADKDRILAASEALRGVELVSADFEEVLLKSAQPEDFLYLDPPYPPVSRYSDFKRYTKEFFNREDHIRLARVVHELDRRGCNFVLSNAKHPLIAKLYSKFKIRKVEAPRYVNCRGDKRGHVPELLVTNVQTTKGAAFSVN